MVTKKDIKFINNLKQKKFRYLNNCFIVEGKKSIKEFIDSDFKIIKLYSVDCSIFIDTSNQFEIDYQLLKKMSFLKNPDDHIAIFQFKKTKPIKNNSLIIALESIRDPGNLGTIIRTCEWFGIKDVVCSLDSVDCYNPKVIQSAMGSISRLNITYLNLKDYLKSFNDLITGTSLSGRNLYDSNIKANNGILIFGNEANGISKELVKLTDFNLTIPRFNENDFPESLNIASSLSIILSEIKSKRL
mgnify:CR=1 FL=1|tara:strand:+ start:4256 stop:4987 length:732 start_codon:yes stop_codon:yes gene_type:complete